MKKQLTTLIALMSLSACAHADQNILLKNLSDIRNSLQTIMKSDNAEDVATLYKDLDQDGVADNQDQCLNSSYGYAVDQYGCELDSDKDGILDRNDQCPGTPLGMPVNFLGCEGDEDKDLVLDSKDQCPNTPLGTKVNEVGCKVDNDKDKDGVIDARDLCPETPPNTEVNENGCKPVTFVVTNIVFNTGSYNIRADQKPILDEDAAQLRSLKSNEIILVTGHTDSVGSAYRNKKLSWNRAQSTKEYLVTNFNYDENQLYVDGKGEDQPIATNKTSEGKQQNRRITFEILKSVEEVPETARQNIPEDMKGYQRWGYKKTSN